MSSQLRSEVRLVMIFVHVDEITYAALHIHVLPPGFWGCQTSMRLATVRAERQL
jgi:hypothetical protein